MHRRLETTCIAQFERLMRTRWKLVEEAGGSISVPFYVVLVFWLVIVFGSFGLTVPRSTLSYTVMTPAGLSIASAIFVILELDTPFEGLLTVSSQPLRDALTYLSQKPFRTRSVFDRGGEDQAQLAERAAGLGGPSIEM